MTVRDLLGGIVDRAPVAMSAVRKGGGGLWVPNRADKLGQVQTMGSVGTVFGIVSKTSTSTASVNWRLFRKSGSGKPEDRTEVLSHPALTVWNKPNDFCTRQELVESVQQHVDLTGEGWLVLSYESPLGTMNHPYEIWFVRPDRIAPVPDPEEFISGYVYTSPGGERVPLERHEVAMIRMPNPADPYRGMGPVQSVMHEIDGAQYSAEWNRNFFLNSAEPGGIVKIPPGMSDPEFNQLVARWNENHRGVSRAHRVAFLENGEYIPRQFSQRDMQFVELSKLSDDKIREAFGFPKFAQGIVDDVNRANAEASKAWFTESLTIPRLDRWKGLLNNDFLPLFGGNTKLYEFDYDNPIPPNIEQENATRASKVDAWDKLVARGVDPDQAAEIVGLPPMKITQREEVPA